MSAFPRKILLPAFLFISAAVGVTPGLLEKGVDAGPGTSEVYAAAGEYTEAGWFSMVFDGDEDSAAEYFERGIALDPDDADTLEGLTWLCLTRGEMERAFALWTDYITRFPERREAETFARHVELFDGTVSGYKELPEVLLRVARAPGISASLSDVAVVTAAELLADSGRFTEAEDLLGEAGFLTDWEVCGVFSKVGMLDLFNPFPVEKNPDRRPDVTMGRDEWLASGDGHFIDFYSILGSSDGVAYAKKDVLVGGGGRFILEVTGDDFFVLFCNGVEVLRHTPDGAIARKVHRAYLDLEPGPARLLIKTRTNYDGTYRVDNYWRLGVRFLDAETLKPVYVGSGGGSPGAVPETEEPERLKAAGLSDHFYAALLYADTGDYDLAVEHTDFLTKAAPNCSLFHTISAYVRLASGTAFWAAGAKSHLRTAELEDPKNVLATEELGVFASAEGKRDLALEKYRQAIEVRPDYVSAISGIAEITDREEWDPEMLRMCERALALNPYTHRVLKLLGDYYYENENVTAAVSYYEDYVALKARDRDVRRNLAEGYIFLGRLADARREYETMRAANPYDADAYLGLADVERRYGNLEAAVNVLEEGTARVDWSAALHEELGEVLVFAGEEERGYRELRRALDLEPSDWRLRHHLIRKGVLKPDKVDAALAVDAEGLLAEAGNSGGDYPASDSVMLLDQLAVYLNRDFSFREENHNLIWILTDKGRERWGEILIMDDPGTEILEARTHVPGEGYLDAASVKRSDGQYIISMERVRPGSVLEVKYNLNIDRRMVFDLLHFYSNPFYLQEVGETLVNTRYVFVVPDEVAAVVKPRFGKYNDSIKSRKVRGDGRTAYIFEKRKSPAVKPEQMTPPVRTFLPYVTVSTVPDISVIAEWYRGMIWGKRRLDARMRSAVDSIASENADDRARARAVYRYVLENVESRGGSIFYPSDSRVAFFNRRGSMVDRAIVISAMLGYLGIENELVLLGTSGGKDDWTVPSPELFDTILVYLPGIDDGTYLDPMNNYFAFGDYWSSCYGKKALFIGDDGYRVGVVPKRPFETDSFVLKLNARLDANGRALVDGRREFHGLRGSYREVFRNPEDVDRNVELNLSDIFEAATINDYGFENLAEADEVFALTFEAVVPTFAKTRDEKLVVPSVPYDFSLASIYITAVKRELPLRLERPEAYLDEATIAVPDGFYLESLPSDVHLKGPLGEYRAEYEFDGDSNSIYVKRQLFLDQGDISPSDYADFARFCKEIDKTERREIILRPAP